MRSLTTGVILSLLLTAASAAGAGDPRDSPVTCSSEGVVCEFGEDNLLDQVPESDCSLTVDGEEQQGVMVTSPGQDTEIVVIGTGLAECSLTLLAVGGGGGQGSGYGGGAGSGHLEYRSLQVSAGTVLTARVGDQREASSLAISGGDTVTAQPG